MIHRVDRVVRREKAGGDTAEARILEHAPRRSVLGNGAPGIRAHYHPNYYGAFVIDLNGVNLEAVCHTG